MPFAAVAQEHPFLILTSDMYPELQARAAGSPWSEIKASAETDATSASYTAGGSWYHMLEVLNDCTLTYVLVPSRRSECKAKILATIDQWADDVSRLDGGWSDTVPPGGAFFMSLVALHIIHPDCTAGEITNAETALEPVYNWFNTHNTGWQLNLYGARMIWALYKGLPEASTHADDYYADLMSQIEPDGFWTASPGYAFSRLGGTASRTAKSYAADVMEFAGLDNRYYNNPRMREFFRWTYTLGHNPARHYTTFGDTSTYPYGADEARFTRHFSVSRFAPEYAKYTAWCVGDEIPTNIENSLFPYILMTNSLPAAEAPVSEVYSSGAAFRERSNSSESLMGVLYNLENSGGHSHDDVNTFYVFGYGEHLVMNSGVYYNSYPGTTPDGDQWRAAFLQNSVTINGSKTHAARTGNGITEGFAGGNVEYAAGDSGDALGNGTHLRSFVFVHPEPGTANGYFVLFDEVWADNPDHDFQVNVHPNSSSDPDVVSLNEEYTATANLHVNDADGGEKITVFLGTEPSGVTIADGWFGTSGGAQAARCVESTYPTDANGAGRAVTVLFPHDDTHAKAGMIRLAPVGGTGARIDHGNGIADIALSSDGVTTCSDGTASFRAAACLYRTADATNAFYLVRQGRFFDDGAEERRGFQSDSDVTISLESKTGHIVSPGTTVTFYYPGVEGVLLDGVPVIAGISPDTAIVEVPAGTFTVELISGDDDTTPPPPPPPDDDPVASRKILYVTRSAVEDLYNNPVVARLETLGHVVTAVDAQASVTADADGMDLVMISSLTYSTHVNSKFNDLEVPVLFWEAALCDDIRLSDKGSTPAVLETTIDVVNTDHALARAAGLSSLGTVTIRNSGAEMQFADTHNLAAGATVIARKTGSDLPAVAVVEQGSPLNDGTTAPGMRLFLFFGDEGLNDATEVGLELFDGAVTYALGGGTPPATSRGTPHDWFDLHDLVGEDNDYEAADNVDSDFDGMNNWEEYLCDTDPTNETSCLRIGNATLNSPFTLHFQSSSNRTYTMIGCTNIMAGAWFDVPGAGPRPGTGGADFMQDINPPPGSSCIYSLKVSLPSSSPSSPS